MPSRVLSVNVARPGPVPWAGRPRSSAIDKRPVDGPVRIGQLGLAGDQVGNTKYHGGPDQAVYVFAREDLDDWGERLGTRFENGQFGENFTTTGIDVNVALLGERWRVGSAVFEVAAVRTPCNTFKNWLGCLGVDSNSWTKRFAAEGKPGPYLRVIEPGVVSAGDELGVIFRPSHDITVALMFRAFMTDRSLLPRLLEVGDSLAAKPRAAAEQATRASYAAEAGRAVHGTTTAG